MSLGETLNANRPTPPHILHKLLGLEEGNHSRMESASGRRDRLHQCRLACCKIIRHVRFHNGEPEILNFLRTVLKPTLQIPHSLALPDLTWTSNIFDASFDFSPLQVVRTRGKQHKQARWARCQRIVEH